MRRYAFDTDFAADAGLPPTSAVAERRVYTSSEIDALEKAAYANGQADAVAQAARAAAASAEALAKSANQIAVGLELEQRKLREEATALALSIGRALAQAALSRFGESRVLDAVERALEAMAPPPRLILRASPDHADLIAQPLQELGDRFGAQIVLRTMPNMALGDVTLEWGDGRMDVRGADLDAAICSKIEQSLMREGEA